MALKQKKTTRKILVSELNPLKNNLSDLKNTLIVNFEKKRFGEGPTEIRTRIAGFKVQSANHYTMGPPDSYER